jgi:predicted acetyltransferase
MRGVESIMTRERKEHAWMSTQSGTVEIREVDAEEFIETGRSVSHYAFNASPQEPDLEEQRRSIPYQANSRFLVAFADGQAQATLTSHEMTQNLRGAVLPMGGVAGVASMPSARRRGMVRQMFERVFELHREMAMPISTLYPFRDSFYERMGYAGFPKPRYVTLKPGALAPLVRLEKPGTCEQVSMKDGYEEWRAFLERHQRRTHGFALRHRSYTRRLQDRNKLWVAFARHEGEIVGAMTFRITGYTEKMLVDTFYTTSSVGRYQLLDWIGRHTDQVQDVVIELRPDETPETWFHDLEATISTAFEHAWPAPMGRVVDVARLGGIGCGEGEVTLDVSDPLCAWNTGRFTFRGEGGRLAVEPGGNHAIPITIHGLSALVFTGHDPADFRFRGWGDPDAATQADLCGLFPAAVPDIHEMF